MNDAHAASAVIHAAFAGASFAAAARHMEMIPRRCFGVPTRTSPLIVPRIVQRHRSDLVGRWGADRVRDQPQRQLGHLLRRVGRLESLAADELIAERARSLLFVSDRAAKDSRKLFVMSTDGGRPTRLINLSGYTYQMVPDGQPLQAKDPLRVGPDERVGGGAERALEELQRAIGLSRRACLVGLGQELLRRVECRFWSHRRGRVGRRTRARGADAADDSCDACSLEAAEGKEKRLRRCLVDPLAVVDYDEYRRRRRQQAEGAGA
jgi:hypothetical protein